MSLIQFPSIETRLGNLHESSVTLELNNGKVLQTSPFTAKQFEFNFDFSFWEIELRYTNLTIEQARAFSVFQTQVVKPQNTFFVAPAVVAKSQTTATVGQITAIDLSSNSLTITTDNPLIAGDYLQVDNRLYLIVEVVSSTITVVPKLSTLHTTSSSLAFRNCGGEFKLQESAKTAISISERLIESIAVTGRSPID